MTLATFRCKVAQLCLVLPQRKLANYLIALICLLCCNNTLNAQLEDNKYPVNGNVGIGTQSPTQLLDVRGHIYTTGSVFIDGGDLVLKRASTPWAYIVRPNIAGYKKLQFAVEGGGPLEELYVNSVQAYFPGYVNIGGIDPTNYGDLQITRPTNATDNKYHISLIRYGTSIGGIGYVAGTNTMGIWQSPTTAANPPLLSFTTDQKVGVGTATPTERFTIAGANGNINIGDGLFPGYNGIWLNGSGSGNDYNFLSRSTDNNLYINRPVNAAIYFRMQNSTQVVIGANGSMGIGTEQTADTDYKLFVEKGIRTRKVKVDQSTWADFVFEKDYVLMTLEEVGDFIKENKHLPGIPSANEVQKNGLNLGDNQAALLQKIEELTLYVIDQNKRISDLEEMKKEFQQLKMEMERLKSAKK